MSCAALFPMSRGEYEQHVARSRGQTMRVMGEIGWVSFPCTDCGDASCLGYGAVLIPDDDSGEIVLLSICARGVARKDIQRFGGREHEAVYGKATH